MSDKQPRVRIRTATNRKKALSQLQELRVAGKVGRALVIVERTDGDYEVLGQEMKPFEVGQMLAVAAFALQNADEQRTRKVAEQIEVPLSWDDSMRGRKRTPEVKRDQAGVMQPPEGENFISCGECHHPRWYVLHRTSDDTLARLVCGHCDNEVKNLQILHKEGNA